MKRSATVCSFAFAWIVSAAVLFGQAPVPLEEIAESRKRLTDAGARVVGEPIPVRPPFVTNANWSGFAWIERDSKSGMRVNHNGRVGPWYRKVMGGNGWNWGSLSDDGKSLAYVAIDAEVAEGNFLVNFDGKAVARHRGVGFDLIAVSPDGKRLAYAFVANEDSLSWVMANGKKFGPYAQVTNLCWSPDSKRVAYAANEDPNQLAKTFDIFVDGERHRAGFEAVWEDGSKRNTIVFSPDSKRWAVRGCIRTDKPGGRRGIARFAVMVDGKLHAAHPDVVHDTLAFPPDGAQFVYAAGNLADGGYALFRDDGTASGKTWNYVAPGSIRFGDGGKAIGMIAYTDSQDRRFTAEDPAGAGRGWSPGMPSLVVNDELVATGVNKYALSPVSPRKVWVTIAAGPAPNSFADDRGLKWVLGDPVNIEDFQFSPDGQHWAALLRWNAGRREPVIVDGTMWKGPVDVPLARLFFTPQNELELVAVVTPGHWRVTIAPTAIAPTQPAAN